MQARYIPNLITAVRFLLVPPLVLMMSRGRFDYALLIFAVMGASDALDGFLAKRYGWQTKLGAYMDPLADKLMLVSSFVTLGWMGLIPLWLVALVIVRDLLIILGAGVYQAITHRLQMAPTLISKFNTLTQIVLVLTVMIHQLIALPLGLLKSILGLTVITTLSSGLHYLIVWSKRTRENVRDESV